jgi:RNase P protein component
MIGRTQRLSIQQFPRAAARVSLLPNFVVKYSKNTLGYNRFGVIVPIAFDTRSSKRHYWKRQILARVIKWPRVSTDFLFLLKKQEKFSGELLSEVLHGFFVTTFKTSE